MIKRKCKLRILDEVNCLFINLHPDHIGFFYEEYAVFGENYFFNPKFKLGQWDGKIRYFHKTGKTYVNLLDEIIPKIIRLGYDIDIVDERPERNTEPELINFDFFGKRGVKNPDTDDPWEMRDYQIDMVNVLISAGNGVGIAGTGAGKTSVCAALALVYEETCQYRSIIIVPDKNLTHQTLDEYRRFGVDVGEFSGEKKDLKHQHIVSTWQTLKNIPNLIQEFQVVIVDEAHGLRGNVLTKLLNEFGKDIPHRFGVTGTMPKAETDALSVRIAVGEVLCNIPAHKLIDEGHLAKLDIDVYTLEIDLKNQYEEFISEPLTPRLTYTQFKDQYFPDWTSEKKYMQTEERRLTWIVDHIEMKRSEHKGNVLCLVNGVAFGKKLAKMIEGAIFVSGANKMKDRKLVYEQFKTHDNLVVVATVNIASTGLDIKRIFNMMFIDMGKSFIRTIQSIGRGLRKAPDKDSIKVTDICSDLRYGKRHLRERIKFYKEAKYPFKKIKVDLSLF